MYKGESVTYGTVESSTGRCWLDRNLGASQVATTKTDSNAYGDLFQWGRLDDGHQNRGMVGTTGTRSTTDIPGHNRFTTNNLDWRNPQKDGLWQGAIGINNPCPAGFRLRTIIEWQLESASWSTSTADGAFNSPLKLTLAGDRYQSSTILGVGERGNYWSNTTLTGNPKLSKKMYYENSFINPDSNDYRSFGACVRCILDE